MEIPHHVTQPPASCASCGASLDPHAERCGVCGRGAVLTLSVAAATPPVPVAAVPETVSPVQSATALADVPAREEAAPVVPEGGRVCDWCGAVNPPGVRQCERCHAAFPLPEQDALLSRASAERVRLAEGEIEMRERLRAPWWKRLFGG